MDNVDVVTSHKYVLLESQQIRVFVKGAVAANKRWQGPEAWNNDKKVLLLLFVGTLFLTNATNSTLLGL